MNNANPLMMRALQARADYKVEVAQKREQARREWIARAINKTIEAAKNTLDIDIDPDEISTRFTRRNQEVECSFTVHGEPLDLRFVCHQEEHVYDHVKADLDLVLDGSSFRVHNLADVGLELERKGYSLDSDPTLAPESESGA